MEKIQMTTPLVEMDGDEMTRVLWKQIKDELLLPYIDLKTEYYDLGLPEREKTRDQVTVDSAEATKKYGVAVKCATITPNAQRVEEYKLSEMWKSPNGTIRAILDGTVFRAPIMVKGISPVVKTWKKPITIARHAYGDVYKCTEYRVPSPGKAELVFTGADGKEEFRQTVYDFECGGVLQGQYNKDSSISSFARSCFQYAIDTKQDLWFATKDTISKKYDHTFKDIFQEIFDSEYKARFDELGIEYFYTLIDDAVARVIRSEGGFIWACKNYDGDVMSDMVRGRPRHRHPPLLQVPEGGGDLHQPGGHPLRLDGRPAQAGGAGRHRRAGPVRRQAGAGHHRHHRGRHHDPRSGGPVGGRDPRQGRHLPGVHPGHQGQSGEAPVSRSSKQPPFRWNGG